MKPIKVGLILASNSKRPLSSTRISILNVLPYLRAAHFDPHICFDPDVSSETPDVSGLADRLRKEQIEIAIFQKVHGASVLTELDKLAGTSIKTVYGVCDLVNIEMAQATDVTIAVTEYLKSLYPRNLHAKIHVVHDGIERPEVFKTSWREDRGSRTNPLRAILVTSEALHELPLIGALPEWLEVDIVGAYAPQGQRLRRLRQAHWTLMSRSGLAARLAFLQFLANRRIHRVAWDPITVYERMRQADIGIIPIDTSPGPEPGEPSPRWSVKSENRLTLKMSVGLPVIATPIPAYEPVIEHGRNGYLARSRQDWFQYLEALRGPDTRRSMGELARASVVTRYSTEEQARRLIAVLKTLTPTP